MRIEFPGNDYEAFQYPAGEWQVRLTRETMVQIDKDIETQVWVNFNHHDFDIMKLASLMDALRFRVAKLTLVMPYLPYARADRRFVEGDCHGFVVFGKIINSMRASRVVTLDAHSSLAESFIHNLTNVSPKPLIEWASNLVQYMRASRELTIVLPDQGARRYAIGSLGLPIVQCEKKRDARTGKLSGFKVPKIPTQAYLIVDDICDGGGTFCGIADEIPIKHSGFLYVTHGIFSKGFTELTHRFDRIFCSDSFSRPKKEFAAVNSARICIEDALDIPRKKRGYL